MAPGLLLLLLAVAAGSLDGVQAAEGFRVEVAADFPDLVNPVTMTFAEDGALYVAEWTPGDGHNDRIKALRSRRGDGHFDEVRTVMEGLHLPSGLLVHDGWLYVPQDEELWRFRLEAGVPLPGTKQVLARGFHNDNSHHRLSGITLGPDGWLYVTTGDSDAEVQAADGSRAEVRRSGGVFRLRPDGSRVEVVAFGMRNPFGNVAFGPTLELFHTDNDNEDGSKFQGCRLLHLVDGGDYGWRLRFGARCCSPDPARGAWFGERPGRLPRLADTGRGAPTGVAVLDSDAFPERFRGTLVHPDVFRRLVRLYTVAPDGATFRVTDEIPLLQATGPDEGLFRPADAEVGPDGALYVLDWRTDSGGAGRLSGDAQHGRLYRITWGGTATEPARPTRPLDSWSQLRSLPDGELIARLASDQRTHAQWELVRRGAAVRPALRAHALDRKQPVPSRLHALYALASPFGSDTQAAAEQVLARGPHDDESVVSAAAVLLGRFGRAPRGVDLLDPRLPPRARREAIRAQARLRPGKDIVRLVDERLLGGKADPFVRDATLRALEAAGTRGANAVLARRQLRTLAALRGAPAAAAFERALAASWLSVDERLALFSDMPGVAVSGSAQALAAWMLAHPRAPARVRIAGVRILVTLGEAFPDAARVATASLMPTLLAAHNPEVRLAGMAAAERLRPPGADDAIALVAVQSDAPGAVRTGAIRALAAFPTERAREILARLATDDDDAVLRGEALRGLARIDYPAAVTIAEPLLAGESRALRREAIGVLGQRPAEARRLVARAAEGKLPAEDVLQVIESVRANPDAAVQAAARALLRTQLTADRDPGRLADAVRRLGEPRRGARLFLDRQRVGCVLCHELEGTGGNVGPSLTNAFETLTIEKVIESIIEPSKEIKEAFETYDVALKDGRHLSGRLLGESGNEVVLRDAVGQEVHLRRAEITHLARSQVSLMPEGTTDHLSLQEFADLIAFLHDRSAQQALRINR